MEDCRKMPFGCVSDPHKSYMNVAVLAWYGLLTSIISAFSYNITCATATFHQNIFLDNVLDSHTEPTWQELQIEGKKLLSGIGAGYMTREELGKKLFTL